MLAEFRKPAVKGTERIVTIKLTHYPILLSSFIMSLSLLEWATAPEYR
jgi:hypothetical protein